MDVGVRDTQELMYRPRAILSTANIAMPNKMYQIKSGQNFSPNLILSSCSVWQCLSVVAVPW